MKKFLAILTTLVLVSLVLTPALADGVVFNNNVNLIDGETLYRFNGEVYVPVGNYSSGVNIITDDSLTDTSGGNLTEQPYESHPRFYEETGTEHVKTWPKIVVNKGEMLVVGGFSVSDETNGVYKGYGPGNYQITVTDGFVSIVDEKWAAEEFNFRVQQAITYNWAHSVIDPGPIEGTSY